MCKSASSVLFWYTRQLVENTRPGSGQRMLRKLTKSGEIPGVNEFVNPVTDAVLKRLERLVAEWGPVVVKTHTPLTPYLRSRMQQGRVKVTFCYRDPRDMILSAIDHRLRSTIEGRPVFEEFTTVLESLDIAQWWCQMACDWIESELPLLLRYDTIVKHPGNTLSRVADYLAIHDPDELVEQIVASEQCLRLEGRNEFNQGRLLRYPLEMSRKEIDACHRQLGDLISRLGFFVNNAHETGGFVSLAKVRIDRLAKFARKLVDRPARNRAA